jgi:hypothetical protein
LEFFRRCRCRARIQFGQAATVANVLNFRFIDAGGFGGIAITPKPDCRPEETGHAGEDKNRMPAETFLCQHENRRQEGEADVLPGSVTADRARTFAFGKPRRDQPVHVG